MPKATLSRTSMREMSASGLSRNEIARKAGGITTVAVRFRLYPQANAAQRVLGRKRYSLFSDAERRDFIDKHTARIRAIQERTRSLATVFGTWKPEEIDYIRKNGAVNTVEEMAIHLRRTYDSVKKAAQRYNVKLRLD